VINLDEWSDYSKSAGTVRCIEHNLKSGNRNRLLIAGVNNVLKHNGFVPEDKDYALELIGEKTPNPSSN
jgi:hypothetical protein